MVGDWEMDTVYHLPDGTTRKGQGEIHFGWALQGRAIQDVWRIPGRNPDGPDDPSKSLMYGTTLRIYDPGIDAWHIIWSDPVKQYYSRQIGRARTATTSCRKAPTPTARSVRWSFHRDRAETRSTGSASARPTAARTGGWKSSSSSGAPAQP